MTAYVVGITLCYTFLQVASKQMFIRQVTECPDEPRYPCKFDIRLTEEKGIQYGSGEVTLPEAWGDDVDVRIEFFKSKDGKTYKKVFESNVGLCKTVKSFMGPFADDLFKAVKLLPRTCPIPKVTSKDFRFNSIKECPDEPDLPTKMTFKFVEKKGNQHVFGNVTLGTPLGNDVMVHLKFQISKDKKTYLKFFEPTAPLCKAIPTFVGPWATDVFKMVHLVPGTCPLPARSYDIKDFKLDLHGFLLKDSIPNGFLLIRGTLDKNKSRLACFIVDAEVKN